MSTIPLSVAPGNVANNANATLDSKLQQNAYTSNNSNNNCSRIRVNKWNINKLPENRKLQRQQQQQPQQQQQQKSERTAAATATRQQQQQLQQQGQTGGGGAVSQVKMGSALKLSCLFLWLSCSSSGSGSNRAGAQPSLTEKIPLGKWKRQLVVDVVSRYSNVACCSFLAALFAAWACCTLTQWRNKVFVQVSVSANKIEVPCSSCGAWPSPAAA